MCVCSLKQQLGKEIKLEQLFLFKYMIAILEMLHDTDDTVNIRKIWALVVGSEYLFFSVYNTQMQPILEIC